MAQISVQIVGGRTEVGRTAILLEAGGKRILLDYGVKLVPKKPPLFPPEVEDVDAVLLTHAHLDHSGAIPLLFRDGDGPPVYAVDVTAKYLEILYPDALKVSRQRDGPGAMPYGYREVARALRNFRSVEYGVPFKVGGVEITPFNSGHIPGGAMFHISCDGVNVLYTGDFNLSQTRLMPPAELDLPRVDLLITESTYAFKEHPSRSGQERLLHALVRQTLKRRGLAIVAGFAIARLTEVAMALRMSGFPGPIFLDGMARRALDVTEAYSDRVRDPDLLHFTGGSLRRVSGWQLRRKVADMSTVVLTTSGMLEGGPVHYYIKSRLGDPESHIVLTGYQIEGTEGRRLLEEGRMVIDGSEVEVDLRVSQLNFSAHADMEGLVKMVRAASPRLVIPVHGEETERFARYISEELGFEAFLPSVGEEVTL